MSTPNESPAAAPSASASQPSQSPETIMIRGTLYELQDSSRYRGEVGTSARSMSTPNTYPMADFATLARNIRAHRPTLCLGIKLPDGEELVDSQGGAIIAWVYYDGAHYKSLKPMIAST